MAPRMTRRLQINGVEHELKTDSRTTLLQALRNDLKLNGPKFGCGMAQCGACAVLVDGKVARACVLPLGGLGGAKVTTLEGLGSSAAPHPVQQAFIALNATQCGYCLNGMIIAATALLERNPSPSDQEIRTALKFHLCRCGSHFDVIAAIRAAMGAMREAEPSA